MKLRTGLTPDAWTPNVPASARQHGYVASVSNRGYIVAGTLAVPESEAARHRRECREYKARLRARGEA